MRSGPGVHDNDVTYTERISVGDLVIEIASVPVSELFRYGTRAQRDTTRDNYSNEDGEWGVSITFLFSLPAAT